MIDLSNRIVKGAAWMVAARFGDRFIGLISTIVLARLLVPADFGLVMMASVIIAALQLLGAFSFDLALIQNPQADRRHYDTVWTINLLLAMAFGVLLVLLAGAAARFFNEPRLEAVMYVLAGATALDGFTNVGIVAFRKELQFDKEFKFLLTKKVSTVAVTVALAIAWRDYWALVVGILIGTIVSVVLSYAWQSYRPRFSIDAGSDLFRFSRWLLLNNTLVFLQQRAADLLLAKGVGPTGLGQYGMAYEIANMPSTELVAPINRAVFPGYAKISGDIAAMRRGFLSVLGIIALGIVPAAVGMACVADPLVHVLLGPKWTGAIPLIQVLALNGILSAIWSCSGYVYLAQGKARNITLVLTVHAAIALPLIAWAAFHAGTGAVAWAVLFVSAAVVPLNYVLLARALVITIKDIGRVIWRPSVAAVSMTGLLLSISAPVQAFAEGQPILYLLILVVSGALTYVAVVVLLWFLSSKPTGAEAFVLERIRGLYVSPRRIH